MNYITNHERPGVYSAYEASAIVRGSSSGAVVGVVAKGDPLTGNHGESFRLYAYEEAVSLFGEEKIITKLCALLFQNGASGLVVVPVEGDANYEAAFALLKEEEEPTVLFCDTAVSTVQNALKASVEEASALRRERIGVVCAGAGETVQELVARAASLNSERMVLIAPGTLEETVPEVMLAAAVAGAIAGEADPAVPLGGCVLSGVTGISAAYTEESVDALIRGGVTVVERRGGEISVVRGVTTRTKTGGVSDQTWRELTTIRIVDDVIPALRNALRSRFTRSKNTAQVRSAIRSQVIMELEEKLRREIITGYGEVTTKALEDSPTVCLVEFSFTVAHGLNQIWLAAKITV